MLSDSTGSSCCRPLASMLASARMMKLASSIRQQRPAAGASFNRLAVPTGASVWPCLLRCSRRGDPWVARARRASPLRPLICEELPKLLDPMLTHRKHGTSHFLIDNFRVLYAQHALEPFNSAPFSLPPCIPASLHPSSRSRLSTLDSGLPSLIANETHSRAESSNCKQDTYEILIANEFHSFRTRTTGNLAWNCVAASVESRPSQLATFGRRFQLIGDELCVC